MCGNDEHVPGPRGVELVAVMFHSQNDVLRRGSELLDHEGDFGACNGAVVQLQTAVAHPFLGNERQRGGDRRQRKIQAYRRLPVALIDDIHMEPLPPLPERSAPSPAS